MPPTATPVPAPSISISVSNTGKVSWSFTPPAGVNSVSYIVQWNEQNHIVRNTNSYQIRSDQWVPGQTYAVYVRAWYKHKRSVQANQVQHEDDYGAAADGHADGHAGTHGHAHASATHPDARDREPSA